MVSVRSEVPCAHKIGCVESKDTLCSLTTFILAEVTDVQVVAKHVGASSEHVELHREMELNDTALHIYNAVISHLLTWK